MFRLGAFFNQQKIVLRQRRQIQSLEAELDTLRAQNDSMRQGMRRCTTCEYRIEYKQRQGRNETPTVE